MIFTQLPAATQGGPDTKGTISGRVDRVASGTRIVLYAHNGASWWVQPFAITPFTTIQPDGSWTSPTHLGSSYAAVLVDRHYDPLTRTPTLPTVGPHVLTVAVANPSTSTGKQFVPPEPKTIHFDGYDWDVRITPSPHGGKTHKYSRDNIWVAPDGSMHLRVSHEGEEWVCAEAHTTRSFGYGTYKVGLRNIAGLEPSLAFSAFTWLQNSAEQNHRGMSFEIGRFGDPKIRNAQFGIEPFYVPANSYRFEISSGPTTTSMRWVPNEVTFRTTLGFGNQGRQVDSWAFTAGVPTAGGEKTYVNLCEYGFGQVPLQHEAEVVIDRFQFLP